MIRKKIDYLKLMNEKLKTNEWKHNIMTNCYAYALNLDIPEICIKKGIYTPGNISGSYHDIAFEQLFTYDTFISNLYKDLEYLNIDYKKVDPDEKISVDEWKIAIYLLEFVKETKDEAAIYLNYHFLKEKNGEWSHKNWYRKPSKIDSRKDIITDPRNANIENFTYYDTYKLKLKKK